MTDADDPDDGPLPLPPVPWSPEADPTRPHENRSYHRGRYLFCHHVDRVTVLTDDAIHFPPGGPNPPPGPS